jgi:hypothetical protein
MKLRRWRLACLGAGVVLCICLAGMTAADATQDKIIATKSVTAVYDRAEIGDYHHAVFKTGSGQEIDFWCTAAMVKFLDRFKGKAVEITYQIVETRIPEAGGVQRIEVIKEARVGAQKFSELSGKKP